MNWSFGKLHLQWGHPEFDIEKTIESRIRDGEPDRTGKPLSGELAGCHRIRTGDVRIVYRVEAEIIEVLIVAAGPRRNDEVWR